MKKLIYLLVVVASASWGTNKPHTPKPVDPPKPVASAAASSNATAGAAAGAVAGARNETTVGVANTVGVTSGPVTATTGDSSAEANGVQTIGDIAPEQDQATIVDASTNYQRQVGTLIMGTVIPVDCGAGGQAGGSNTHAAGFLGFAWTTDRCYTLKAATAWAAMGQYDMACEMLADVTRRAMRRRAIDINCTDVAKALIEQHRPVAPPAPKAPDMSLYMLKSDAAEREKRILEKLTGK